MSRLPARAASAHMLMMGVGRSRLRDPVQIGTGSFLASMGLPAVYEDGRAGTMQAVRYLAEMGHRAASASSRRPIRCPGYLKLPARGFLEGLSEARLDVEPALVYWTDNGEQNPKQLERFISKHKLTGAGLRMHRSGCPHRRACPGETRQYPGGIIRRHIRSAPRAAAEIFGGVHPTTVSAAAALRDGKTIDGTRARDRGSSAHHTSHADSLRVDPGGHGATRE